MSSMWVPETQATTPSLGSPPTRRPSQLRLSRKPAFLPPDGDQDGEAATSLKQPTAAFGAGVAPLMHPPPPSEEGKPSDAGPAATRMGQPLGAEEGRKIVRVTDGRFVIKMALESRTSYRKADGVLAALYPTFPNRTPIAIVIDGQSVPLREVFEKAKHMNPVPYPIRFKGSPSSASDMHTGGCLMVCACVRSATGGTSRTAAGGTAGG